MWECFIRDENKHGGISAGHTRKDVWLLSVATQSSSAPTPILTFLIGHSVACLPTSIGCFLLSVCQSLYVDWQVSGSPHTLLDIKKGACGSSFFALSPSSLMLLFPWCLDAALDRQRGGVGCFFFSQWEISKAFYCTAFPSASFHPTSHLRNRSLRIHSFTSQKPRAGEAWLRHTCLPAAFTRSMVKVLLYFALWKLT